MTKGEKRGLKGIGEILKHPRKYIFTIVFAVIFIFALIYSIKARRQRDAIDYKASIDQEVAVVNDVSLTLRDLAYYVVQCEKQVQAQAEVYDEDDPEKYWRLHTDGIFLKENAKQACIDMAVHDQIFYDMAKANGIELTEEDEKYLANSQIDFWFDMCDYDKQDKIGISKEEIDASMEKCAIAQKYQELYAAMNGFTFESCNYDGDAYLELLKENKYKINEKLWERVDFGFITVNN